MASLLPPGRMDSRQSYVAHQQQRGGGSGSPGQLGAGNHSGSRRNSSSSNSRRGSAVMRAVNSCRSVAVSDAILTAQSAFAGGEFQPEAFPRCVCLLLEAFEGGDNAIKLCVARFLERFRPYFGGTVLAVEVAQRACQVLSRHDDPTTRELCLDVLTAVSFGAGGLPHGILVDVARSLRSPFLAEKQAAARVYASCMCVHRRAPPPPPPPPPSSSSLPGGAGRGRKRASPSSPVNLAPQTLDEMRALSSALLPLLSWDGGDVHVSALTQQREQQQQSGEVGAGREMAASGRRDGIGFAPGDVERLLGAVLWKVEGDLPSTELWESLKVFLFEEGTAGNPAASHTTSIQLTKNPDIISVLVDMVLCRLRSSSPPARFAAFAYPAGSATDAAAASLAAAGNGSGGCNPALRAIAVDLFVSLMHVEAVERSKFAMAAAEAAVKAADAAAAAAAAAAASESSSAPATAAASADAGNTAAKESTAPKITPVAAAPTPGRSAVWRLLDALSSSETEAEKAELLSVLGAPALAVAVLDAEAVAGAKSAGKMAAAHGVGDASSGGGGGGVSEAHACARTRFPLATAAVERFRGLCRHPSSSSAAASPSAPLARGAASALVSFSVAAFRETPFYPAGSSISSGAARRDKAMSGLAELAVDGALTSSPMLRLLSAGKGSVSGGGLGGGSVPTDAAVLLPQLRALAAVHAWPRRRIGLAVVGGLEAASPRSPVAVDLAVLASHVVRAGEGGGDGGSRGSGEEDGDELERALWELLFGRRFCDESPKAAVGIAVALMRYHRGSLSRQSTLSAALVRAMGGLQEREQSENASSGGGEGGAVAAAAAASGARSPETADGQSGSSDPLVRDPWFQLVLCRECMLHGFHEAAEAGLRRLRGEGVPGGGGAAAAGIGAASESVWVWTEVLRRVSAAEAFFGGSSDPVAAHACAAHETALAAELLDSLPRPGRGREGALSGAAGIAGGGVRGGGGVGALLSGGGGRGVRGGGSFVFQRSFLQARAELLRLLGACWGMCQDLSATRTNRYARFSRREARCRRLPAAFRRLARDFRLLRGLAPGAGSTTSEPLRAASCLCLFLAIAADALLSQGKSVLMGSREKGTIKKKSWRAWLERLIAGGPGAGEAGETGSDGDEVVGEEASAEGALMKAVRVLGARLLGLSETPKAAIGRVAFTSILQSVRCTPFPLPRAFFRTGVTPRVALSVLPPAPPSSTTAVAMAGPDGAAAVVGNPNHNTLPPGGQQPPYQQQHQHHQTSDDFAQPSPLSAAASPGGAVAEGGFDGGESVGEKRQRRDGGVGARYYGPSCRLRAEIAEAERSRHPRLPLISASSPSTSSGGGGGGGGFSGGDGGVARRMPSSLMFSAAETWWAQTVREEALAAPGGVKAGVGVGFGGAAGGWQRGQVLTQMSSPGVWLVQGMVCRGRGAGGALPAASEVILDISIDLPSAVASGRGGEQGGVRGGSAPPRVATKSWSTQVVADILGAAADSATALCFRAEVHLPALVAPEAAAAVATAAARNGAVASIGAAMEIVVSLRSRGKQLQHDDRTNDTGFVPLGSGASGSHGGDGGVIGVGEKEVWTVGTVSVPVPSLLSAPPAW